MDDLVEARGVVLRASGLLSKWGFRDGVERIAAVAARPHMLDLSVAGPTVCTVCGKPPFRSCPGAPPSGDDGR